jgi:hypothetical protein
LERVDTANETESATLAPSLLAFIGHPAYGLDALRADLDRFTFLLGGNDGEEARIAESLLRDAPARR